jgi:hypothetical protein
MKPDAICIFIGPSISIFISGKPYLQRPLFTTAFQNPRGTYIVHVSNLKMGKFLSFSNVIGKFPEIPRF